MRTPLWVPSEERKRRANITRFMDVVNARHNLNLASYSDLYDWSVSNIPDFWAEVWDFAEIKASKRYDRVVDNLSVFPGTKWFPGARLNFAENLLRHRDDHLAFIFKGETQVSRRMTYAELYDSVARLSHSLAAIRRRGG
jgi:acetoacetyl-CoA synthetase